MKQTTYSIKDQIQEKAVLVSLITDKQNTNMTLHEQSFEELVRLAETAGVQVVEGMMQSRESADSRWLIGKGKVQELKQKLEEHEAGTAIFDQELSGAQVRNLEEALDVKIIDRTQLILDIFAQRAKTREGILQVGLAQMSYLLPRLSGHGKNLSRLGGGIGTRGPGESQLETDRRHIRTRIRDMKQQLEEVTRTRSLHRERRKKTGQYQIALVGYTNAGKSTLLKQLTDADVYIENQLFATLDPTSRILQMPSGKEVILTDTVGFIQNLPHDVVAAFRATLEEVNEADLILHVVDSSSDMREEQMQVVQDVLDELGAGGKDQITVFNKIDLLPAGEQKLLVSDGKSIQISAFSEDDLNRLLIQIEQHQMGDTQTYHIPLDRGDLISIVYRMGEVLETETEENEQVMKVRLNKQEAEKNGHLIAAYAKKF
jgi:GTP-binding protein HflX